MVERRKGAGGISGRPEDEGTGRAPSSLPGSVVTRRTFLTAVGGLAAGGLCVLGMKSARDMAWYLREKWSRVNPLLSVYEHIQIEHGMWNYFPSEGELSEQEREVANGLSLTARQVQSAVDGDAPVLRLMLAYAPWVIGMYEAKWSESWSVRDYRIVDARDDRETIPSSIDYMIVPLTGVSGHPAWVTPNAALTRFVKDEQYGKRHSDEFREYVDGVLNSFFGDDSSVAWDKDCDYLARWADGPDVPIERAARSFYTEVGVYLAPWHAFELGDFDSLYKALCKHLTDNSLFGAMPYMALLENYDDDLAFNMSGLRMMYRRHGNLHIARERNDGAGISHRYYGENISYPYF